MHKAQLPSSAQHLPLISVLQPALTFLSGNNQWGVWARAGGNYRVTVGKLLWGNPAVSETTCREDAPPGTLITSFPSRPVSSSLVPSFFLSVSPSLPLYFSPKVAFIIKTDVHHQLWMDLANTPSCMWTCFNTLCVENFLVRISLSATCHCCLSSSFRAHQRRVRLCAPCNPSSGNGRLQLDTHRQSLRLSLHVTSSSLLNVLAAFLWTLSSLSTIPFRCP